VLGRWVGNAPLLLRACHPEPTAAVTAVTLLLAVRADASVGTAALVGAAVLTGQLSIGWSNDLIDSERDAHTGRLDKPTVAGGLSRRVLVGAVGIALVATIVLSLACGVRSGLTHLLLGVGSGWAYNLRLKSGWWSWLPYAVAFGSLPAVVWLAVDGSRLPPCWLFVAGALLGVGAHLVNVLPDIDADIETGVRGFPHRIGRGRARAAATASLVAASLVTAFGPGSVPPAWGLAVLSVVVLLAGVGLRVSRLAFHCVVAIAGLDLLLLLLR
jgi:4-hydroxybenzoate polyprenyltransferase